MKAYWVEYYINGIWEDSRGIQVLAKSKVAAYDKAVYEIIPEKEGQVPYSAWVVSVTYNNGNYRIFNTSSGNPY